MVTLAPELKGAREAVAALAAKGIVVSIGHTECTLDQVKCGGGYRPHIANHEDCVAPVCVCVCVCVCVRACVCVCAHERTWSGDDDA